MSPNNSKLICHRDDNSGKWVVYLVNIPGLVVQVHNIDDAPKKLATAFEELLINGFKDGIHDVIDERIT